MGRLTEFFDYLSGGTGHYRGRYYWIIVDLDLEIEVAEYRRLFSEQRASQEETDNQ